MNALRNLSHNGEGLHSGLAALAATKRVQKQRNELWCCRDGSSPPPFTQKMSFRIALSVCLTVLDVIKVSVVVPCSCRLGCLCCSLGCFLDVLLLVDMVSDELGTGLLAWPARAPQPPCGL